MASQWHGRVPKKVAKLIWAIRRTILSGVTASLGSHDSPRFPLHKQPLQGAS